ncbi:hypothetical protein [Streptomyces beijiangensis]|uniref:Uncharacterized protein n=1 Tax=Streptomyces beijiangensis TaxID=163361 RepID=A0A939FDF4_9ACTN|nr:hypothetical protein [Streptomyces beijiangensis]MBO0516577.1 hypothetical protein [Streptomyces beijiangensis]
MARTKLNERQLAVLRRICHDDTPVTSDDSRLAVTVYALRSRGLVTTTRTGGRWSAAPTEAGHRHLTQDNPAPTPPKPSTPPAGAQAATLFSWLQQSGGSLHITAPTPAERARWRRILHTARAENLIPDGHHLQYTGRDKGDLSITLRTGPPVRPTPTAEPIPVPDDLSPDRLHPVARDAPTPVCPSCQPRARRILHALCHAAEDKNYTVSTPVSGSAASLVVSAADSSFPLSFDEGSYDVPDPDGVKYAWQRVTARITRPSHQLELSLQHTYAHPGRRFHWGDRQRWRLEDKLPALLREITHRADTEHERHLAQQHEEEATRERWLAAMAQARTTLIEDHRRKILRTQVESWQEATAIRAYCRALEDDQAARPDAPEAAKRWIAWARAYAEHIDPVSRTPGFPDPPAITPEDLRPYLHGWSPYEPKQR